MENELEINGKKYICEETINKPKIELEFFETKVEAKLHKQLKKMLEEKDDCLSDYDITEKPMCVMDECNVMMIIGKTTKAKTILKRYISKSDQSETNKKIPDLKYDDITEGVEIKSKYSLDYLKNIMDFLLILSDGCIMKIKNDYPMTIDNTDFSIVLAPRVDNE